MPAETKLARQHERSHRGGFAAILLTITVLISCVVRAETPANSRTTMEPAGSAASARPVIAAAVGGVAAAVGPQAGPQPALFDAASRPLSRKILKEVGKQTVDQPGHFLIAAAPIWASRYLVGVPWYGWAIAPLLAYREWLQWPSKRWWDPPLDWIFLSLGAVVATFRRRPSHRAPDGLASLRGSTTRLVVPHGQAERKVASARPSRRSAKPRATSPGRPLSAARAEAGSRR
jgi:hypothetical protein